jgi:periplasmic copper chaperone A
MPCTVLTLHRGAAVCAATAVALVATATGAAAHVTVQPGAAEQGGFSALSFRVPTERADAATTSFEVTFPAEQPLAFVSVKPHPGWSYQVKKATLAEPIDAHGTQITDAVSVVTWTADNAASAIKPGEYDEFSVSVGYLPEDNQMVFKAVQTYDSGEVVRWIEQAAEGADEPEHPAPVLALTAAQAAQDTSTTSAAEASGETEPVAATGADNTGTWLGGAALVVSLIAAGLAWLALRRRSTP